MSDLLDITQEEVAATGTIHLKNAAGEPLFADRERTRPARIIVHGPGTPAFAAIEARQTNRAVKRMQDNDGKVTVATPEERLRETAEDLAAITIAFENFSAGQGAPVPTTQEQFAEVYRNPKLGFIVKQVTKFIGDWGNFTPGSPGI